MEKYDYKIVDTNILLLDASNVISLGADGATIVIPETVVDELDDKKSTLGELGFQAREFGRLIARSISKGTIYPREELIASVHELDGVKIHIVSSAVPYMPRGDVPPSVYNDRKIISIAKYYPNAVFLSNDVMCRIRAEAEGIETSDFKVVESIDFEFTKTLKLDPDVFVTAYKKPIADLDPHYIPENYNYVLECKATGQTKIGTVTPNGLLEIFGKETEKDLRRQDINPMNSDQLFFSKALQDTSIDVVVCEALAGSGKTAVALSNGIRMVRQGHYDGILYIRASVDDVEDVEAVGFLPGLEEKFAVYLHPLEDTLQFIVRNRYKESKLKGADYEAMIETEILELKTKCNIEAMTGLGMRGRTFSNMYIIIDEVQNQSKSSLQKMLTRVGKNCKVVLIGSLRQIDNKYITKFTSGLATILDAARSSHDVIKMHAITLHKVVRSPMAEWAEKLFSKK
jgi:PhoH-like ATPase